MEPIYPFAVFVSNFSSVKAIGWQSIMASLSPTDSWLAFEEMQAVWIFMLKPSST